MPNSPAPAVRPSDSPPTWDDGRHCNTQNNGGGIYELDIACDGRLGPPRRTFGQHRPCRRARPDRATRGGRSAKPRGQRSQDLLVVSAADPSQVLSSTADFPDGNAFDSSWARRWACVFTTASCPSSRFDRPHSRRKRPNRRSLADEVVRAASRRAPRGRCPSRERRRRLELRTCGGNWSAAK